MEIPSRMGRGALACGRLAFYAGILGVLTCVVAGCRGGCTRDGSRTSKVVVAQWGQEKYLIYLPVYVAMEKGFFKDEGLEVSLTYSGNDDQVFASVLQGGSQFGVGDPVFTAIANEKAGNLGKVVASIVGGVAIWGVTNQDSIPVIESKSQLAGLRVGTFPAPSTNYTLMADTITSGGAELHSTKIVQAPIGGQIALLEGKQADIAMVLEPAASLAEAKGYRVVFSSPKFYGAFAFTGLTVSTRYANEHPEVVQGMVKGVQRALDYCHSDPEGASTVARQLFPSLEPAVVDKAVRRMVSESTLPKSVVVSEDSWSAALKTRITVGDLKALQPYHHSVDMSFADAAIRDKAE